MEPWKCEICKQAITPEKAGMIEVYNANPEHGLVGAHPMQASEDPLHSESPGSVEDSADVLAIVQVMAAQRAINTPVNIGIKATHNDCTGDNGAYHIHYADVATLDKWIAWGLHLSEKTWMGYADFRRFIGYWWDNRGRNVPPLM